MIRHASILVAIMIAACGGSPIAAPASEQPRPNAPLDQAQMIASLPQDINALIVLDVGELRQSPIAAHAWNAFRNSSKGRELFDSMCGSERAVDYALIGVDTRTTSLWAWIGGRTQPRHLDCPQARDRKGASATVTHGDYELSTSERFIVETLWVDSHTRLVVMQETVTAQPVGEELLRRTSEGEGGKPRATRIGGLLEHANEHSGVVFVAEGDLTRHWQNGLNGLAASIDLTEQALSARLVMEFDDENHATELRDQYRLLFDKLTGSNAIADADTHQTGARLATAVSVTRQQADRWIDAFAARLNTDVSAPASASGAP